MAGAQRLVVALSLLAAACAGCGTASRHIAMRHTPSDALLFNPAWTGLPSVDVPRQDWPSVAKLDPTAEVIDYQETIVDQQGLLNSYRDRYYRRLDSVRAGRGHR